MRRVVVLYSHREGVPEKEKEERKMKEYEEKMDILMYMIENGYHLMGWTMDEFCEAFSLEDLRRFCARFMGEDPRE